MTVLGLTAGAVGLFAWNEHQDAKRRYRPRRKVHVYTSRGRHSGWAGSRRRR